MPKIAHCDRTHCVLVFGQTAAPAITLTALLLDYRCAACDGKLEAIAELQENVIVEHTIICPHCAQTPTDVKHTHTIRKDMIVTIKILEGLPPHLRAMVQKPVVTPEASKNLAKVLW